MANYAVIDVGSNSIRLVVYSIPNDNQKAYRRSDFSSLANDKVMAGLAAYVSEGVFTPAGIKKATSTIKSHLKHASYFKCKRIDVFATAVLRNAQNSAEAIEAIEKGAGCKINLISGEDEALLGFAGASSETLIKNGVTVDIGGGSTELTRVEGGVDSDDVSLGQGSLSSFARFVRNILPAPIEMDAIACEFRGNLRKLPSLEPYKAPTLYGVGGSTRAAAKLVQQLDELQTRPREVKAEQVQQILRTCRENPSAFGHVALKASAERVHTMVPGCVILAELFRHLGADKLVICKHGVREGYLIERMLGAVSAPPQAD